jgi:hypothetical protein
MLGFVDARSLATGTRRRFAVSGAAVRYNMRTSAQVWDFDIVRLGEIGSPIF